MPSSTQLYHELTGLQDQMKAYSPIDSNDVEKQLLAKVDNFKPQYEALHNAESQAYAAPGTVMANYESQFGNNPLQGPSAAQRYSGMLGDIGRHYALAATLGDVINTQKGRIGDLTGQVVNQYNLGRQGLQDQYQMKAQMWQQALQQEEAAKQRAAAQSASDAYAKLLGGGGNGAGGAGVHQWKIGDKNPATGKIFAGYDPKTGAEMWGNVVNNQGSSTSAMDGAVRPAMVTTATMGNSANQVGPWVSGYQPNYSGPQIGNPSYANQSSYAGGGNLLDMTRSSGLLIRPTTPTPSNLQSNNTKTLFSDLLKR